MIRNLFKWSLQLTGLTIVSYHYFLKPQQQAECYGFYRSVRNSTRTSLQIYKALKQYKTLLNLNNDKQTYQKQLHQINLQTAKRIQSLSQANKGVYIRMAQNIGHMRLVFPNEFQEVLSKVNSSQINQQPVNYSYIKKYLQKQLRKTTKLQFQSLNTNPVKCDVFSQTYKGQLIQSFADVLVTILYPYARAQAKYDFLFLKRAADFCNNFQQKYFKESEPLLLNTFLNNLQKSINQQLNIKQEEEIAKKIKTTFQEKKITSYVPHYISDLTTHSLKIVQFINGTQLQNIQDLKKNKFDLKNLTQQIPNTFNMLLGQGNILYDIHKNKDIKVRKSWPSQTIGTQFISVENFSRRTFVENELYTAYQAVWKGLIQKKVSKGKQKQKTALIQTFYKSLPDVLLYQILKNKELTKEMSEKQIDEQKIKNVTKLIQKRLNQQVKNSLIQSKLMENQKKKKKNEEGQQDKQTLKNYQYLSKTFQMRYQPWKFQSLYKAYMSVFETPLNFGTTLN